ncbi:lytic transglycosylase domain-containing protein [Shewanella baltica]|uniref:transglycosylase SLT domain-containing protein n=1 Tax=Shewanella baltica TaxID=62322 RepID=UPI00217D472B|nr:transglycosylase SLT domain-containing protein [Shewanella baltica]MCS6271885.1 lytic transglycosylase domain-containing protein [Shewanella baltica]
MRFLILFFLVSFSAESSVRGMFHLVSKETSVPEEVLLAVCTHESQSFYNGKRQPWPWTINVAGDGFWFKNKESAVTYADLELDIGETKSIDIGLCQINWYWHGSNFESVSELMDPITNVRYAAKYLSYLKGGKSWEYAVGAYHSPSNAERARLYSESVFR